MSTWLRNHAVFNVKLRMATEDIETFRNSMKSQILHTKKIKNLSRISCKNWAVSYIAGLPLHVRLQFSFLCVFLRFLAYIRNWLSFVQSPNVEKAPTIFFAYFPAKTPQNMRETKRRAESQYLTVAKNQEHSFCHLHIKESDLWKFQFVTMTESIFSVFWLKLEHRASVHVIMQATAHQLCHAWRVESKWKEIF